MEIGRPWKIVVITLFLVVVAAAYNNCAKTQVERPPLKESGPTEDTGPLVDEEASSDDTVLSVMTLSDLEPQEIEATPAGDPLPTRQFRLRGQGFRQNLITFVLVGGQQCRNVNVISTNELTCDLSGTCLPGEIDVQITTASNDIVRLERRLRCQALATPTPSPVVNAPTPTPSPTATPTPAPTPFRQQTFSNVTCAGSACSCADARNPNDLANGTAQAEGHTPSINSARLFCTVNGYREVKSFVVRDSFRGEVQNNALGTGRFTNAYTGNRVCTEIVCTDDPSAQPVCPANYTYAATTNIYSSNGYVNSAACNRNGYVY